MSLRRHRGRDPIRTGEGKRPVLLRRKIVLRLVESNAANSPTLSSTGKDSVNALIAIPPQKKSMPYDGAMAETLRRWRAAKKDMAARQVSSCQLLATEKNLPLDGAGWPFLALVGACSPAQCLRIFSQTDVSELRPARDDEP